MNYIMELFLYKLGLPYSLLNQSNFTFAVTDRRDNMTHHYCLAWGAQADGVAQWRGLQCQSAAAAARR